MLPFGTVIGTFLKLKPSCLNGYITCKHPLKNAPIISENTIQLKSFSFFHGEYWGIDRKYTDFFDSPASEHYNVIAMSKGEKKTLDWNEVFSSNHKIY